MARKCLEKGIINEEGEAQWSEFLDREETKASEIEEAEQIVYSKENGTNCNGRNHSVFINNTQNKSVIINQHENHA